MATNRIRRGVRELAEAVVAGGQDVRVLVLAGNPLGREGVAWLVEVRSLHTKGGREKGVREEKSLTREHNTTHPNRASLPVPPPTTARGGCAC